MKYLIEKRKQSIAIDHNGYTGALVTVTNRESGQQESITLLPYEADQFARTLLQTVGRSA